MKRFLGILVASMFLASADYAGEAMKEDAKPADKNTERKAKTSDKKTDSKAKASDAKAAATGDAKKSDMTKEKPATK